MCQKLWSVTILKNMFRFEPVISGRQGVSLFESGQFPSSLVGDIVHRTLQARQMATPLIRIFETACRTCQEICSDRTSKRETPCPLSKISVY